MSTKRTTVYFEIPGKEHTNETLILAREAAIERNIDTVIIATTAGETAFQALKVFKENDINLIFVTHQTGCRGPGVQEMLPKTRIMLEKTGAHVLTGTEALTGGVSVGISRQRPEKEAMQGGRLPWIVPPVPTIIASTLRLFGQGVKVCVEITMMAADAGLIAIDKSIIAVAGTHWGADTAMVIKPSSSNRIKDLRIREILAKPFEPSKTHPKELERRARVNKE